MIRSHPNWLFAGVFHDIESGLRRSGRNGLDKILKKTARWYGAVQQGLKRVKRPARTPLLWMKDGYRVFLAKMFAITEYMMKTYSEMKLLKSGFLILLFRFPALMVDRRKGYLGMTKPMIY